MFGMAGDMTGAECARGSIKADPMTIPVIIGNCSAPRRNTIAAQQIKTTRYRHIQTFFKTC